MAFFTIFIADGLSEAAYKRALAAGPTFASTRHRDHGEMLRAAGFPNVEEEDLTEAFLETTEAWVREREKRAPELISAEGDDVFHERQEDNTVQARAIKDGLLRRAMFVCS